MSHAPKSWGQNVEAEAPQKLGCGKPHDFILSFLAVMLVAKMDLGLSDVDNTMIADSDLMSVASEVFDHRFRGTKGALA